ncbi:MAG: RNA-binding protein [Elusimicrobiales bacterium]|nr:RNA-binding protein [Elusimicrobiales bacterium]MCK5106760.1 RNA-binding protein [Elusimicrobiales bacterium]
MGKKLYVGNLPFSVNDDSLKEQFSAHGTVETAQVIMDKFSGRSKGFGFVEMSSDEEAKVAIEQMSEKEVDGRKIVVNEARPMEKRERGGFGGGRGGNRGGGGGGGGGRDRW